MIQVGEQYRVIADVRNAPHSSSRLLSAGKLIAHEAMSGLSKVLQHLDEKNIHLLVVYIFMKIKPFLESVSLWVTVSKSDTCFR